MRCEIARSGCRHCVQHAARRQCRCCRPVAAVRLSLPNTEVRAAARPPFKPELTHCARHRAPAPVPVAIAQRCRYTCGGRGSKRRVDSADPAPRCLTPQPGRIPMRQRASALMIAGLAAVFGFVGVAYSPSAQTQVSQPGAYNPYPPGILPTDLDAEIARVRREVQFIFNEALNEWRALAHPILAGNPPTLRGSGYQAVDILGKLMNLTRTSPPREMRPVVFAICHMRASAGQYRRSI